MYTSSLLVGILVIFIGFIIATLGWKIHSVMIAISGFVIGVIASNLIVTSLAFFSDIAWIWGISILSGIFTAIIFIVYKKTSIGVTSGLIGAAIISDLTSTRTLVGWDYGYPILETRLNYLPISIAFLISTYAGLRFYKLGYVILSAGIGAILVAWGGTLSGLWAIDRIGFPLLLSLFLGAVIQLAQEGSKREMAIRDREMKYCSKCKKGHPKDYLVCPDCGAPLTKRENE